MPTDQAAVADLIEHATGLRIQTCEIINSLSGNLVVEINGQWIFRFATTFPAPRKTTKQLNFVASFVTRSPVAVPAPAYVTDHFVGYRRIAGDPFSPGDPFTPSEIDRLSEADKRQIAKQLGEFLATLHRAHDDTIDFDTGYLSMREGFDRACPDAFTKYLRADECRSLDAKLEAIADNDANFSEPATIIHGDLYFGNILWDATRRVITGVIDWSEMGRGIPAMDFIALADFTTSRNDQFLQDIFRWYGADERMFAQVKQNAIIEVMNWFWFYEARKDATGIARAVDRLKAALLWR